MANKKKRWKDPLAALLKRIEKKSGGDREAQRRSFAYGNCAIDNPNVTRELVDRVADEMKRPPSAEGGGVPKDTSG